MTQDMFQTLKSIPTRLQNDTGTHTLFDLTQVRNQHPLLVYILNEPKKTQNEQTFNKPNHDS